MENLPDSSTIGTVFYIIEMLMLHFKLIKLNITLEDTSAQNTMLNDNSY